VTTYGRQFDELDHLVVEPGVEYVVEELLALLVPRCK
jgi:hypothetical protein